MPSEAATQSRTEYWRDQIVGWRASGQSQRGYCREWDLNYAQFVYWRKKFDADASASDRGSGFVPVTYAVATPSGGLSLVLPNGLELRGIGPDNLALVEQLLRRLA